VSGCRPRRLAAWVAAAAAALVAAALPGAVGAEDQATLTVRVDARDFSFALSRRSVPAEATVRFVVRNRGKAAHRFVVNRKRTRALQRGKSQTITVRFPRRGSFRFLCTVDGHARRGMRGTLSVTAPPAPPPKPEPPAEVAGSVALTRIGTFERPVLVTAPPGDGRLFVVEHAGTVRIVKDGEILPRPFVDLRDQVKLVSESGLLSIAFAPDYATSGLFYAFYNTSAGNGDIRISELRRHPTDPDLAEPFGERVLITIPKPWENHNGGMLQFGPDGYLYASVGDGDSGVLNPPGLFAQRREELLGDILRIDPRRGEPYDVPADNPFVGVDGVRPEIWAYGLRNPWRFWIDDVTGATYIADAGHERREEVDLVPRGLSGLNFGWPCFEGTLPFDSTATCDRAVAPLLDFPRDNGVCTIIGGVVSRDPRIAALEGRYLYADFCLGRITAVAVQGGRVADSDDLDVVVPRLSSFGMDSRGSVYVTSLGGDVFRLDPKPMG
jgi:glucose/arabinose dehydrogenase